jgi:uncharacterized membrane protein
LTIFFLTYSVIEAIQSRAFNDLLWQVIASGFLLCIGYHLVKINPIGQILIIPASLIVFGVSVIIFIGYLLTYDVDLLVIATFFLVSSAFTIWFFTRASVKKLFEGRKGT